MLSEATKPSSTCQPNSLAKVCRGVVVSNLERYPAEAFAILDELEWESIIVLRHNRTRPLKGKGGLDGKGRVNPAVGDKFMAEVESELPHLAQSHVLDTLIWKDIVEHKYRSGGLSRPNNLMYPWPVLEESVSEAAKTLSTLAKTSTMSEEMKRKAIETIDGVADFPMDIALLKTSGIGKAVKKFLKAAGSEASLCWVDEPYSTQNLRRTPRTRLESVLQTWMKRAEKSGVEMKGVDPSNDVGNWDDLEETRKCNSWRELFVLLGEKDDRRRSNQGARMRERRQKLDSVRPKIVKVRHASSRQHAILNRDSTRPTNGVSALAAGTSKMQQLRTEARVISSRRAQASPGFKTKKPSGFGAAVAFASVGKKRKPTKTMTVELAGGKRMKVPDIKKASGLIKQRLEILKRGTTKR